MCETKLVEEINEHTTKIDFYKINNQICLPSLINLNNLIEISIVYVNLKYLPKLNSNLKKIVCVNTLLTSLPELPNSLEYLDCSINQLISLPTLPNSLEHLNCSYNQLISLPELPNKLKYLYCENNNLINLPNLPNNLYSLSISDNNIKTIFTLPNNLKSLYYNNNKAINLPILPISLRVLEYNNNYITELINNFVIVIDYDFGWYNINIKKINEITKILHKFKNMFYSLKFRKHFYKLFEKIIIKKYHPCNLIKLLENVGKDEEKIDNLIQNW